MSRKNIDRNGLLCYGEEKGSLIRLSFAFLFETVRLP
jgi:hypothetical protein